MILRLLLNTQMICKMFRKILKSAIQKKHQVLIVFDDMIADSINKKN